MFEVAPITSKPIFLRIRQATLPTPPAAPVTTIGPSSIYYPAFNKAFTHKAAVNPAVPYIILSLRVIF